MSYDGAGSGAGAGGLRTRAAVTAPCDGPGLQPDLDTPPESDEAV